MSLTITANFKVGDEVYLPPGYYSDDESNPVWGGYHGHTKGVIVEIDPESSMRPVYVRWASRETNVYNEKELRHCTPPVREHFDNSLFKV